MVMASTRPTIPEATHSPNGTAPAAQHPDAAAEQSQTARIDMGDRESLGPRAGGRPTPRVEHPHTAAETGSSGGGAMGGAVTTTNTTSPAAAADAPPATEHRGRVQATASTPQPAHGKAPPLRQPTKASGNIVSVYNGRFICGEVAGQKPLAFLSLPVEEQLRLRRALLHSAEQFKRGYLRRADPSYDHQARPKPPMENPKTCEICPQLASYLCSNCCHGWYCSRQCQVSHWSEHRDKCVRHRKQQQQRLAAQTEAARAAQLAMRPVTTYTTTDPRAAYYATPQHSMQSLPTTHGVAHYHQAIRAQAMQAPQLHPHVHYDYGDPYRHQPSTTPEAPPREQVAPPCAMCSKTATIVCSRCKAEFYCTRECQVKAWSRHEATCRLQTPQTAPQTPSKSTAASSAGTAASADSPGTVVVADSEKTSGAKRGAPADGEGGPPPKHRTI
mmetsp:Transcript_3259/g.7985  ORF Transcript_3259/g.7985 Transcript_3259/m.7985 type:complete len:444 (-) Transcript_3259:258-1589(-)